ncbi:MAG: hypothetical protein JXR48_17760 [Candidatus Delongbacteria bacterium]|nr:hypothetical protein [Candidatus Delongbacteria bacterium]MBN2836805.1 hypothetical protein [Candidatus Delongbacteria bacterium]
MIKELIEFMDDLSFLIYSNGHTMTFIQSGKPRFMNVECIDSSISVLKMIDIAIESSYIGNAYTLLRKYRDELFLFLYLLEASERDEPFSSDETKESKFVQSWFNNAASDLHIGDITKYLNTNKKISRVIKKHDLFGEWKRIQNKLNDYVHSNGYKYVVYNTSKVRNRKINEELSREIQQDVVFITILFIVILILVRPNMISSTDYIDSLDVGLEPTDGSQYFVAPFVEDFVKNYIDDFDVDLRVFLKDNMYMDI